MTTVTPEQEKIYLKIARSQVYEEISAVIATHEEKYRRKWLWYLRPNHNSLMKMWGFILDKWYEENNPPQGAKE